MRRREDGYSLGPRITHQDKTNAQVLRGDSYIASKGE
jgi:hypothetical protein